MTYDISATRAQLKTLLQTVSGLAFVYDYMNPDIEGYPAAIFDVTNEDSTMLDDANNIRVIQFTIWIAQEVKTAGQQDAKDMLDAVVKTAVNTLELKANDTLGNTVDWIMPVIGQRMQTQSPEGLIMTQEIILRANISSTIV